jgi:hypothetical protein
MRQIKINATIGSEIITVQNVKDYVRIDTAFDDNIITYMISMARIWCENYISRDIVSKNRTYYLDSTNGTFDLPFGPVSSIQEVKIDGTVTVDYEILGLDNETIELDGGYDERVLITYVTLGINDNLVKQAMLQLVSTYYDNRADFNSSDSQDITEIPTSAKTILTSYKTMFL